MTTLFIYLIIITILNQNLMEKNNFNYNNYSRIFNWFAFALIFYNGLAGVLAAVLRGLLSVAFSILLFIRLDRVILMKGFERFDKGNIIIYSVQNLSFYSQVCNSMHSYTSIT